MKLGHIAEFYLNKLFSHSKVLYIVRLHFKVEYHFYQVRLRYCFWQLNLLYKLIFLIRFTQLVRKYIALGVKPSSIGVITPYWAQVRMISGFGTKTFGYCYQIDHVCLQRVSRIWTSQICSIYATAPAALKIWACFKKQSESITYYLNGPFLQLLNLKSENQETNKKEIR